MPKRYSTWRKQRTALERALMVMAVFGVFLGITPAVATASTILKNMDRKVNPCDDFYRFACGGFLKSTFISDDENYVNALSTSKVNLKFQLRATIEEPSQPNERKPSRLIKNLYKSCMNKSAIEDQGLEPLRKILKKLGGWPVLEGRKWNETNFDWIDSTYKFRETGYSVNYFFRFEIIVDRKNPTRRVISLDTGNLGTRHQYLLDGIESRGVKAYYNYMSDIAILLGAEKERARAQLMESLLFEIELAKITPTRLQRYYAQLLHTLMTLDELSNKYPSIPWREYLSKLLPKNIAVKEDEVVLVNVPKFISDIEELLCKTPKRVQANYLIWRAVQDSVKYLNDAIRNRQLAYLNALNTNNAIKLRSEECVDLVSKRLPIALSSTYVRKYSSEQVKQDATEMVTNIKTQFYKILEQVEWKDEKSRQEAIKEAESIPVLVAYPEEFLDDVKLEKFFGNIELSEGNFFDNHLKSEFFNTEYSFGKLRERVDKNDWEAFSSQIIRMGFYNLYTCDIYLPAGYFQDPFFSNNRPEYMNYGHIGFIIGHRLADALNYIDHEFTNVSEQSSAKNKWHKRMQCIKQQYDNFTVEEVGLRLNGFNTNQYNIADNAGIKQAYFAYNDWAGKNDPEKQLPGLSYSPNQMFWISAANLWCTKWAPEALKRSIVTSDFSPPEFRVLGSMMNMPEFSNDFGCPIGSKMNPEKRCSVW